MKTNLEIEYKSSLTRDDYQKLINHFPFVGPIQQFNTYYDTRDALLRNQEAMCRVRVVDGISTFTLKEPHEEGVLEHEFVMTDELHKEKRAQAILTHFHVGLDDLVEVTYSNTVRFEYKDTFGTWCLDVTQFPHHKDYELEYELHRADSSAHPHFLNVLKTLGIEYIESSPKYLRALNSKPDTVE